MKQSVITAIACSTLTFAACGQKTDKGNRVDIDRSGDTVDIRVEEENMHIQAGEKVKLPASFPKDIYIPPKATLEMAAEMEDGMAVTFSIAGASSEVGDEFLARMSNQGWQAMQNVSMVGQRMMVLQKDNLTCSVVISATDDNKTHVAMTVGKDAAE